MRKLCLIYTLIVFFLIPTIAQEDELIQETTKFQISEINEKEELTNILISDIRKSLKPIEERSEVNVNEPIDSLTKIIEIYTEEYIQSISVQSIRNALSTVNGISENIKSIQLKHTSDINELQELDEKLEVEHKYWEEISVYLVGKETTAQSIIERVQQTIINITEIRNYLDSILKDELENISLISQFNTSLKVVKDVISEQEEILRNSYLVRDSEAIWKIHKIAKDTLKAQSRTSEIIAENTEALNLYVKYNSGVLITHLIIILLLFLLFKYSQKLTETILSSPAHKHLAYFSKKPFYTAYVYSFLFVSFFGTSYPVILLEVYLITLFIPIYHLLKTYIKPNNRKYLIVFIILFTFQLAINHISYVYISGRLFLLALEVLIFAYLVFLINSFQGHEKDANRSLLRNAFILATFLFLAAAIANLFGIVRLSLLLSVSTINSIGIGMLIFLFYQLSRALFIVLAEIRPFSELNVIKERKNIVIKRLTNITRFVLIFLFFRGVLKQFKLYKLFLDTWQGFVNESWKIGEVNVSIGDFLNFFLFIFIAFFAAKTIKHFLGGEILPLFIKKRGMPNAISTSVYYIVLVIGLFLAASSTGIEWNKVNLALGALSVGIGFGLQNVVYNFIAGLILTYERPVQVGDIIQLSTLIGSIKEIGVRSSRVLTYDGAEVVVPNGNLISNEVINWTLSNNSKRQELKFKASTNANPKEIVKILETIPLENPKIISDPKPLALFEGYGDDGTLDFRLLFWTHIDVGLSSKSEVGLAIYEELQKKGYELPVQKSSIRIENNNLEQQ